MCVCVCVREQQQEQRCAKCRQETIKKGRRQICMRCVIQQKQQLLGRGSDSGRGRAAGRGREAEAAAAAKGKGEGSNKKNNNVLSSCIPFFGVGDKDVADEMSTKVKKELSIKKEYERKGISQCLETIA